MKNFFSDPQIRSRDIYEHHPNYPLPPLAPLPNLEHFEFLKDIIPANKVGTLRFIKFILLISGFKKFSRELPDNLESLMRKTNLRVGGLFMPVISASLALKDDPRTSDPFERAATLIKGAYSLHKDISSGTLTPDKYKDHVLEMGQYPNLFSTCTTIINNRAAVLKSTQVQDVLIMINRRQFILRLEQEASLVSVQQIRDILEQISEEAYNNPLKNNEAAIGIITASTSGTQFKAFRWSHKNKADRQNLERLRHIFITVCLDLESAPLSYSEAVYSSHADNMANRWFHSSLQLVVFGNARACVIGNFGTYIDGNVMMRGAAEIQKRAQSEPLDSKNIENPKLSYQKLIWRLPGNFLRAAWRDVQMILDTQQATFEIEGIGRNNFSEYGFQPVNMFIIALELAAYRLTGKVARVTQFLSMSKYRYMGLITAVVTTSEVKEFVEHYIGNPSDKKRTIHLLKKAVHSISEHTRKMRRTLPFHYLFSFFVNSRKKIHAWFVIFLINLTSKLLNRPGIFRLPPREILISHPAIYPEVPIPGRPGVRLPYVKYFGLHYQIFDKKTIVTMMPGTLWRIPNTEVITEIRKQLTRLEELIKNNT